MPAATKSPALAANPDTLIGYIPKSTNSMVYYNNSFQPINWFVVNDVSEYDSASKYSAFVAGDEPFAYIDNPTLNDGSACAVVKESYGNAFIPFLVDHYQMFICGLPVFFQISGIRRQPSQACH